jgi:hypothetical protein
MGVGRSGTSALTRVLNLLGAALPPTLNEPGFGNERGFWEPTRIVDLSDEILARHGSDWFDTGPFPHVWFDSEEAHAFCERTVTIIETEYNSAPLIAIKDPRICRLAPLYWAALERLDYRPRAIIPLRHPTEMIASLQRREGTDPRTGELIWIRHMLETELHTRRSPRIWVTYDELLDDWQGLQAKIATRLDVAWPNPARDVADKVESFLEPALRHFDTGKTTPSRQVGALASRLWQVAQSGLAGNEAALQQGFDGIRWIIDEVDRLGVRQAAERKAHLAASVAHIDRLSTALHDLESSAAATLRSAIAAGDVEREKQRALTETLAVEADNLRAALAASESGREAQRMRAERVTDRAVQIETAAKATIAAAADELAATREALADCDRRLQSVVRSRSWKYTGPLRTLRSKLPS